MKTKARSAAVPLTGTFAGFIAALDELFADTDLAGPSKKRFEQLLDANFSEHLRNYFAVFHQRNPRASFDAIFDEHYKEFVDAYFADANEDPDGEDGPACTCEPRALTELDAAMTYPGGQWYVS